MFELNQPFFRIVDNDGDTSVHPPVLQLLFVVRVTPKGGWVTWGWAANRILSGVKPFDKKSCRLVIEGTGRAFAYPTIELAMKSYVLRKKAQIRHANSSICHAENALDWMTRGIVGDGCIQFEKPKLPPPPEKQSQGVP